MRKATMRQSLIQWSLRIGDETLVLSCLLHRTTQSQLGSNFGIRRVSTSRSDTDSFRSSARFLV